MSEPEIDAEALEIMHRYCGADPRIPREVEVEAFSEYGSEEWTLSEFTALLASVTETIPEASRESAVVTLDGNEFCHLKITYRRLQTQEEVAERVRRAMDYVSEVRERDRRDYARLKAKFAATPS